MTEIVAASSKAMSTFVMSLLMGWDRIPAEQGGRPLAVGDLVLLGVMTNPPVQVTCPGGWTQATSNVFYKFITANEPDPVFSAEGAPAWYVVGRAYAPGEVEIASWQSQ